MGEKPAPEILVANRLWPLAMAGILLVLAVASVGLHLTQSHGRHYGLAVLTATSIVAAAACSFWAAIRPSILRLDSDGFVVSGGLSNAAKKVLWAQVTGFFVFNQNRLGQLVGYNFRPGIGTNIPTQRGQRRMRADGAIASLWEASPAELAAKLNDYRRRALESGTD